VLSFTAFNGGNTTNVIPSEVKLMGTFRAMDEVWRFKAHDLIKNQARSIVEGMGANIDIKIDVGYPFVLNNEKLSSTAMQQAIDFLGQDNVEETELRMGAEDFAYYSHEIPGCFFRLGVGNIQKGISIGVHTSTFNIDENAIETGISAMALFGAIG
jgi:hippurate hydrolase